MSRVPKTEVQMTLQRFQPLNLYQVSYQSDLGLLRWRVFQHCSLLRSGFGRELSAAPHSRIREHKDDLDRVNKVRDGSVANIECLDTTPKSLPLYGWYRSCVALSCKRFGELFGWLDYAAVAQRIRRTRLCYSEKTSRTPIAEMSNV